MTIMEFVVGSYIPNWKLRLLFMAVSFPQIFCPSGRSIIAVSVVVYLVCKYLALSVLQQVKQKEESIVTEECELFKKINLSEKKGMVFLRFCGN